MIVEAIIIGIFILIGAELIYGGVRNINDTLQRILKRWAALENLGIFPDPLPEPPEPSQAIKGAGKKKL